MPQYLNHPNSFSCLLFFISNTFTQQQSLTTSICCSQAIPTLLPPFRPTQVHKVNRRSLSCLAPGIAATANSALTALNFTTLALSAVRCAATTALLRSTPPTTTRRKAALTSCPHTPPLLSRAAPEHHWVNYAQWRPSQVTRHSPRACRSLRVSVQEAIPASRAMAQPTCIFAASAMMDPRSTTISRAAWCATTLLAPTAYRQANNWNGRPRVQQRTGKHRDSSLNENLGKKEEGKLMLLICRISAAPDGLNDVFRLLLCYYWAGSFFMIRRIRHEHRRICVWEFGISLSFTSNPHVLGLHGFIWAIESGLFWFILFSSFRLFSVLWFLFACTNKQQMGAEIQPPQ